MRTAKVLRWSGTICGLSALAACRGAATTPRPLIFFTIDAPLCSMKLPAVLSIDGAAVATDTFVVHLGNEHLTAGPFTTSVGQHVLSARSIGGYVWPDKSVTLTAGGAFTDSLPFYCS
jgi:hypothetical protein